jgi:MYXO-CTERM domain-containing protein
MRGAQLALLARPETAHPSLWAAFIVSGDDGPMPLGDAGVPTVAPAARGCACTVPADGDREELGASAAILLAVAWRARRRRRRG